MTIFTPATPEERRKQLLIASVMNSATKLASMDDVDTVTVLRAIANQVEAGVKREFNLCTQGQDLNENCKYRTIKTNSCKLKSVGCEYERSSNRELPS